MVSDTAAVIFVIMAIGCVYFMAWCIKSREKMHLIHKLYFALCVTFVFWSLVLLAMKYADPHNERTLFIFDSLTYVSVAFSPVLMLMVAMSFVTNAEKMPRKWWLLFIVPVMTNIIVWTNPLHHLQYEVFSVYRDKIVFGPYMIFSGAFNYLITIAAIAMMLRFAIKSKSRLYMMQSIVFAVGDFIPLVVSVTATLGIMDLPITATPMSYICVLVFHYFAIYRMHMLDITPIATQHVLDWVSDCYLILSDEGLVVSCNAPFRDVFGTQFGISENKYLKNCVKEEDIVGKTAIYNLLTAVESCRESNSVISYEQAVNLETKTGEYLKLYYLADVSPLNVSDKLAGFVVILKDFTEVKKSMQQVQDSQRHMMEQERLAFLGQMVGGLAHNLKTPIMSISGCMAATESLIEEARQSLDDSDVTPDDYREMFGEMDDWVQKTRDSCAYMSDIITAIKGQAANAAASQDDVFTLDELIKRSSLLMRHELLSSGCKLELEYDPSAEITFNGDINNLVQVINNLVSNAIDAERQTGGDKIYIGVEQDEDNYSIYVKDTGPGVEERVRKRLFNEMITSKGAGGTGLGLYISNAIVRGKFGGSMWVKENPNGGSIFGMSIPLSRISIAENKKVEEVEA